MPPLGSTSARTRPFLGVPARRTLLRLALALTLLGLWALNHAGTRLLFRVDVCAAVPDAVDTFALTFDDGPSPEFTPAILDILAEHDARATFFVVGEHAEAHPELIERILAEGHEIGHHTHTHPQVEMLPPDQLAEEMDRTCEVLFALGADPAWYRPPRKDLTFAQKRAAAERGMRIALWTRTLERSRFSGANEMAATLVEETGPGDVLLAHDGRLDRSETVDALPLLLEGLNERGLTSVTLSELHAVAQ